MPRTVIAMLALATLATIAGCASTPPQNPWREGAREVFVELKLWRAQDAVETLVFSPTILVHEGVPSSCSIEVGEPPRACYTADVLVVESVGRLIATAEVSILHSHIGGGPEVEPQSLSLVHGVGESGTARSKDFKLEVHSSELTSSSADPGVSAMRRALGQVPATR